MALSKAMLDKLLKRDAHCWDCGATDDLVPHHRRNRQMGGSSKLDRLDNLMMVCAVYNGLMESDLVTANQAREFGHKLASWQLFSESVFDKNNRTWYVLDERGNKTETSPPMKLI
jgi:5-methylcytosine-specific restriction endonuclease McrA